MDSQIVVRESALPVPMVTVQQWAERRKMFNEWVNTQLKSGVDYGTIPGTDKPTLLKPGAEKIAQLYGCAPKAEVTLRQQDAATGYLYVEVRCDLVNIQTGQIVATGLGCCSSFESKYRWRWEWWNSQTPPATDLGYERTRNGKWRRRTENRDLIDQWNTVLKIGKKRAMVDASLSVSGASEKFTQDMEDFPAETLAQEDPPAPAKVSEPAPVAAPKGNGGETPKPAHWSESGKVRAGFWAETGRRGLTNDQVHTVLGHDHLAQYPGTRDEALALIDAWINARTAEAQVETPVQTSVPF
uniref:Uncharacterized protein n=1 Tax=viral metagenome TaxID=1070528 RepID=A0A6M3JB14_9ZZZZ